MASSSTPSDDRPPWAAPKACRLCGASTPEGHRDTWGWRASPDLCDDCDAKEAAALKAREARANALRCGIPDRFLGYSLKTFEAIGQRQAFTVFAEKIKARPGVLGVTDHNVKLWETFKGYTPRSRSFWVCGPWGAGKSLHAAALAQDLLAAGTSVAWYSEHELFGAYLKRDERPALDHAVAFADVLFLDDVGVQAPDHEWMAAAMEWVISTRYHKAIDVVITSNVEAGEWLETTGRGGVGYGGRVASRLVEMLAGDQFYLGGIDWRRGVEYEAPPMRLRQAGFDWAAASD